MLCVLVFFFFFYDHSFLTSCGAQTPIWSNMGHNSCASQTIQMRYFFAKELNDFNRFKQISTDLITALIRFESRMHTDKHSKLIIYKLFIYIWIFTRKTNTQCTFTCEMWHFKFWDIHCKRNYDALRKTITKMFKACIYYDQIINHFMWIKCKPATKPWCIKS